MPVDAERLDSVFRTLSAAGKQAALCVKR